MVSEVRWYSMLSLFVKKKNNLLFKENNTVFFKKFLLDFSVQISLYKLPQSKKKRKSKWINNNKIK